MSEHALDCQRVLTHKLICYTDVKLMDAGAGEISQGRRKKFIAGCQRTFFLKIIAGRAAEANSSV